MSTHPEPTTTAVVDRHFAVGPVDPRLFGSFAEHLGRCIYGGLYEPGHPAADAKGYRQDVLELIRELGVTMVRYPGGNFVSGYRWEDGVGPVQKRPRRRDLAWVSTETNHFGTDEFLDWCGIANVEPMLAVNLGTRGIEQAADFYEYVNHPGGTELSDRRAANGHPASYGVKLWCLGNEMDGPWQLGHKTAVEYGRLANEAAKAMFLPDRNDFRTPLVPPEFIVCGSSGQSMPTFGTWEREVLEHCYDKVSYLSLHSYANCRDGDVPAFLAHSHHMGAFIDGVVAICDGVKATKRSARTIHLSFDEWNVWYHSTSSDRNCDPWTEAPPLLEDVYNVADALVVGGCLITFLNRADRVKLGCLAQLVNVIGPIMTRTGGPAWRQTIFHPFALASRFGRGTALQVVQQGQTYDCAQVKGVPYVDLAVIAQDEGGVVVFALNRDLVHPRPLQLDLGSLGNLAVVEWLAIHEGDLGLTNTEAQPDRVVPRSRGGAVVEDGRRLRAELPPASWSVIRLG